MAWTRHGHHIVGTIFTEPRPEKVARCGGPGLCDPCSRDAAFASKDTGDFINIGPECFTDRAKNVISWRGQEYVRTCGEFVQDLPEGGQAFCTLTYDHPGDVHVNTHI